MHRHSALQPMEGGEVTAGPACRSHSPTRTRSTTPGTSARTPPRVTATLTSTGAGSESPAPAPVPEANVALQHRCQNRSRCSSTGATGSQDSVRACRRLSATRRVPDATPAASCTQESREKHVESTQNPGSGAGPLCRASQHPARSRPPNNRGTNPAQQPPMIFTDRHFHGHAGMPHHQDPHSALERDDFVCE